MQKLGNTFAPATPILYNYHAAKPQRRTIVRPFLNTSHKKAIMFNFLRRKKPEEQAEQEAAEQAKVEQSLSRTRQGIFGQLASMFKGEEAGEPIDAEMWDDLEALLLQADLGPTTADEVMYVLRTRYEQQNLRYRHQLYDTLKDALVEALAEGYENKAPRFEAWMQPGYVPPAEDEPPAESNTVASFSPYARAVHVILVVGVNGTGKTTTIAKLARYYQNMGRSVILAAADTFRAAAIEQLQIWGERVGAPVVASRQGGDPGAVVYDACQRAITERADVLIIDTAGRLHNKANLMEELRKISKVASRIIPAAPHEVLLVIDATTGQNALSQARAFSDVVTANGVVLAKLDGTAKGGIAFAISREVNIPIKYIGTGEKIDDFAEFNPRLFVNALFEL
jgi:fused signal recognition particle receptor